jgi:hypothetical protein
MIVFAGAATAASWHDLSPQGGTGQLDAFAGGPQVAARGSAAGSQADRQLAAALVKAGTMVRTLTPTPAPRKSAKPAVRQSHLARPKPAQPASPAATLAPPTPTAPVYQNPLRAIAGLLPERVDMGADFGGTGPIYAIGDAVVTNATGNSPGWPGGGWITYQLTDGPAAGLQVYVAEDVTPTVQVGEHVSSSTVIADMYDGGAGIETGWAMPDGASAESQLPEAGSVSGGGPFPVAVGINFDQLLMALGVPAGSNASQAPFGLLPPNYPTSWSAVSTQS